MSNMTPRDRLCPCGKVFTARTNNVTLCPVCRKSHKHAVNQAYYAAHIQDNNDIEVYDPPSDDPINVEIKKRPWVLRMAPPGCDISEGAQFTAMDLYPELARNWVMPGMVFMHRTTREVRRF